MLVAVGLDVVVGMAVRVGGQRRARLDGQRVGADVRRRGLEGEHVARGVRCPVGVGLAGAAEDQVQVPEAKPAAATGRGRLGGLSAPWRRPRPASTWGTVDCTPREMRVTPAAR